MDSHIVEWFLKQRGITQDTLDAFKIGQDGGNVVFPYSTGNKYRSDPTLDKRVFFWSDNSKFDLFHNLQDTVSSSVAFLVEGESDTLKLWQELRNAPESFQGHVYGLSGVDTWQPHFRDYFEECERVYVILDNDNDYNVKGVVDKAWKKIRLSLGSKARRIVLPLGVKDLCEFFSKYDLNMLSELCRRKAQPITSFNRLDLTREPPPMDWLVEDLICKGDVNLLIGNPGLGKSWLMMSLAVAIAKGDSSWLDKNLMKQGRVVFVDEENPEDIIIHRMKKLGLTDEAARDIFYFYRPGIWLNKEPELLLEEVSEIEPVLIVLDSLSRLHSEDENNANSMANLFREAITPLSRETGAATVVIHHTVKNDNDNSFQRARGSGDISAAVDSAIDARGSTTPGKIFLSQYKSRRSLGSESITVSIRDTEEGVRLFAETLPF